jgi:hypothetical protein
MPMFRVAGRRFAQLLPGEREMFILVGRDERDSLVAESAKYRDTTFKNGVAMILASVPDDEGREVLTEAWRLCASRRLSRLVD